MRTEGEWILADWGGVDGLIRCADAICDVWPDAVVEDTAAGEFAHCVDALLPTEESELCVYRDLDAARLWQQGGARRQMHNSMIQISLAPGGVRLIADDWSDPALVEIVAKVGDSVTTPARPGGIMFVKPAYNAR